MANGSSGSPTKHSVPTEAGALKTLPPRPAAPLQRLTARPLSHDLTFDQGAYDESYDRFRHAAQRAFGEGPDGGAA